MILAHDTQAWRFRNIGHYDDRRVDTAAAFHPQTRSCPKYSQFAFCFKQTLSSPRTAISPHSFSREKDFFAQLEDDFDLHVVEPRRRQPPAISKGDFEMGVAGGTTRAAGRNRGIYLLLGTLRGTDTQRTDLHRWMTSVSNSH